MPVSLSGIDLPSASLPGRTCCALRAQEPDCISPNIPPRDTGTLQPASSGKSVNGETAKSEAEVAAANRAAAMKMREEMRLQRQLREEEAKENRQAMKPDPESRPESGSNDFAGVHAGNYETAKEICSALPSEQIARELGLSTSTDEFEIAEAYAADGYTDRFRQAGFEGCLDGLLSHR